MIISAAERRKILATAEGRGFIGDKRSAAVAAKESFAATAAHSIQ
jgi:hypothetical protein